MHIYTWSNGSAGSRGGGLSPACKQGCNTSPAWCSRCFGTPRNSAMPDVPRPWCDDSPRPWRAATSATTPPVCCHLAFHLSHHAPGVLPTVSPAQPPRPRRVEGELHPPKHGEANSREKRKKKIPVTLR
ncbi:uncharacterized protein DS421_1g30670 [Arachis hypogaea]|nr:uncharacterized protein DS421_1g30670 [Arachis hypogaea]